MGRTKGVKNGEGMSYARPKINVAVGAVESFAKLREQGFLDQEGQLTAKGQRYVRERLTELGVYNVILFENFFLKGDVDYREIEEVLERA